MAYLTVAEIADRLRVYPGTVKRWLRDGTLVGVALGDRAGWRITEEDLEAFLARQRNVRSLDTAEAEVGKLAA